MGRDQRPVLDVAQDDRAALHHVVVGQDVPLDPLVVDDGPVGRLQILDEEPAVLHPHRRVPTRHHAVIGPHRAFEAATDEQRDVGIEIDRAFTAGRVAEQ
ncbi:MAG: hypothetical protein R3B06_17055 [Kofleriaceae bacterium]